MFRVFVGMRVDGFMATTDNAPAWGQQFDPRAYGYDEFIQHIAVVVIGRTTSIRSSASTSGRGKAGVCAF